MSTRKQIDLNRYRKTYPLIRRKPRFADLDLKVIETVKLKYEPGEYSKTHTFNKVGSYVESPICVATAENENLNAYIVRVDRQSVTVEISSPAPQLDPNDSSIPEIFVHLQIISRDSEI